MRAWEARALPLGYTRARAIIAGQPECLPSCAQPLRRGSRQVRQAAALERALGQRVDEQRGAGLGDDALIKHRHHA